jgi:hypothetical protein
MNGEGIMDDKPEQRTKRTRARHGSGSIYQQRRRDGTLGPIFWTKLYVGGRPIRESTLTDDRQAAEAVLRERLDRLHKGMPIVGLHRVTIGELLDDLQGHYDSTERRDPIEAKRRLAPLRTVFGTWKAIAFDAPAWNQHVANRRRRDHVANSTLNRELALLLRAYSLGLEHGKVARVPIVHALKEPPARTGFLERDEFAKVIKPLAPEIQLGLRIAYFLAWRRAEVFKLERWQVDLESGALSLPKTKNGDRRHAYLSPELLDDLREHLAKVDALQVKLGKIFRRVFVYVEGKARGRNVGKFRKPWGRAIFAAGKPGAIVHDLRRSGIRNMIRDGVSETVAMKVSGHRTRSVFSRYDVTSDADLRAVAERVGHNMGITGASSQKTRVVNLRTP